MIVAMTTVFFPRPQRAGTAHEWDLRGRGRHGTHTRILIVVGQGTELASAEGPGSAVQPGAASRSAGINRDTVHRACAALSDRPLRALCVGVAGAGRDEERDTLQSALEADRIAGSVAVLTDAEIALEDAFGAGPGILLTAGTGSIAYGKGPTGLMARCGGWGRISETKAVARGSLARPRYRHAASADGRDLSCSRTRSLRSGRSSRPHPTGCISDAADSEARTSHISWRPGDLRANLLVTLAVGTRNPCADSRAKEFATNARRSGWRCMED
jgi:hypothetical protein